MRLIRLEIDEPRKQSIVFLIGVYYEDTTLSFIGQETVAQIYTTPYYLVTEPWLNPRCSHLALIVSTLVHSL